MTDERITKAAELICKARLERLTLAPLIPDELRPRDETEAYLIQAESHRLLTEAGWGEIVGYKIGCTTAVMQEALGLDHPVYGGIFRPTVWERQAVREAHPFISCPIECAI